MGILSKDAEQLNNDLMMDQGALKAYHSIVELFKGDNVKNFQGAIRKHCLNSYEAAQVIQSTYLAIRNTIQSELNSLLFDEWLPELSNISTELFHYGNACGVADNIDKEIIKRLAKKYKKQLQKQSAEDDLFSDEDMVLVNELIRDPRFQKLFDSLSTKIKFKI